MINGRLSIAFPSMCFDRLVRRSIAISDGYDKMDTQGLVPGMFNIGTNSIAIPSHLPFQLSTSVERPRNLRNNRTAYHCLLPRMGYDVGRRFTFAGVALTRGRAALPKRELNAYQDR